MPRAFCNNASRLTVPKAVAVTTVENLILDMLEWIGPGTRSYAEVQEAWRTSCPRLPVWEDAKDAGYLESGLDEELGMTVAVSTLGAEALRATGRCRSAATQRAGHPRSD